MDPLRYSGTVGQSTGGILGTQLREAKDSPQSPQVQPESQMERMERICNSIVELHARLQFVNRNLRGAPPPEPSNGVKELEPERTLLFLTRAAEAFLERCHTEANEIANQVGG